MKCDSKCGKGEPEFWCKCSRTDEHGDGEHLCGICGETW